ncbi:hypothetical protein E2320_016153 [Naja naja]|nr:hypothetical protein E2320_016153 [Naja naja]
MLVALRSQIPLRCLMLEVEFFSCSGSYNVELVGDSGKQEKMDFPKHHFGCPILMFCSTEQILSQLPPTHIHTLRQIPNRSPCLSSIPTPLPLISGRMYWTQQIHLSTGSGGAAPTGLLAESACWGLNHPLPSIMPNQACRLLQAGFTMQACCWLFVPLIATAQINKEENVMVLHKALFDPPLPPKGWKEGS